MSFTTAIVLMIVALVILVAVSVHAAPQTPEQYWQSRLEVAQNLPDNDPAKKLKIKLLKEYIKDMKERE